MSKPQPPIATLPQPLATVAVTGGNGFIAAHIVHQLLQSGRYHVTATVRSTAAQSPLWSFPGAAERLRLVQADLLDADSWNFEGIQTVMHVASPFVVNVKDPQKDLVDPAVQGTLNVLRAAMRDGVSQVILTSSIATLTDQPVRGKVWF